MQMKYPKLHILQTIFQGLKDWWQKKSRCINFVLFGHIAFSLFDSRVVSFTGITWRLCSSRASVWSPAKAPWRQDTNAPSLSHGLHRADTRWGRDDFYQCYNFYRREWIKKCLHKSVTTSVEFCLKHLYFTAKMQMQWFPICVLTGVKKVFL